MARPVAEQEIRRNRSPPLGRSGARAHAGSQADVIVENFRPGTLEQWDLGYDTFSEANPGLVMVRISGYGQTGPYRDRPGFGVIGEAMGGLRHLNGGARPDSGPRRRVDWRFDRRPARDDRTADGALQPAGQWRPRPGGGRRALRVGLQHDGEPRPGVRRAGRGAGAGRQRAARNRPVQRVSLRGRHPPDRRQRRRRFSGA